MAKILIIDHEREMRAVVAALLQGEGFLAVDASCGSEGLEIARKEAPDAVLLDLETPDMEGVDILQELKKISPYLPVIVVTTYGDISTAVSTVKLGAYDFMLKPPDFEILIATVKGAVEMRKLSSAVERLHREMDASFRYLLGKCEAMAAVIEQIHRAAGDDSSVLIQGEPGTGKSFVTEVIHNLSARARGPFACIDISAVPESLVERELFGYPADAFTGAEKRKKGYIDYARGGTLVIEGLQNASPRVQDMLMRIWPREATRIIGTTTADLKRAVGEHRFREDLYGRISGIIVPVPPLRERKGDIVLFANRFLYIAGRELNKKVPELAADAQALLQGYPLPGNLRELKNLMRRAVRLSQDGVIGRAQLESLLDSSRGTRDSDDAVLMTEGFPLMSFSEAERYLISKALKAADNDKAKAAALLQIDQRTLLRKIKQYGCEPHR